MIYTIGYSGSTIEDLRKFSRSLHATIVDVRMSPYSRNADFKGENLRYELGDSYTHLAALGNVNYKGGPIKIKNPHLGIDEIERLLSKRPSVILMCMCKDHNICHRSNAADMISEALDVEVYHLPNSFDEYVSQKEKENQKALFA